MSRKTGRLSSPIGPTPAATTAGPTAVDRGREDMTSCAPGGAHCAVRTTLERTGRCSTSSMCIGAVTEVNIHRRFLPLSFATTSRRTPPGAPSELPAAVQTIRISLRGSIRLSGEGGRQGTGGGRRVLDLGYVHLEDVGDAFDVVEPRDAAIEEFPLSVLRLLHQQTLTGTDPYAVHQIGPTQIRTIRPCEQALKARVNTTPGSKVTAIRTEWSSFSTEARHEQRDRCSSAPGRRSRIAIRVQVSPWNGEFSLYRLLKWSPTGPTSPSKLRRSRLWEERPG